MKPIPLTSDICIQSNEVNEIDPSLLAVAVPVRKLAHPSSSHYSHSFPSSCELATDKSLQVKAMKFIKRLSADLHQSDVVNKLRDIHLLMYFKKHLIDPTSLRLLCDALQSDKVLPMRIRVLLEMAIDSVME